MLNSIADVFRSCTTENRKVSSGNSLVLDDNQSGKSLIWIKKVMDLSFLGNPGINICPCKGLTIKRSSLFLIT